MKYLSIILLIALAGCIKPRLPRNAPASVKQDGVFIIKSGADFSTVGAIVTTYRDTMEFEVYFDSSCIYPQPKTGFPVNKLYGVNEGNGNTGYVGWMIVPPGNRLTLWATCTVNGKEVLPRSGRVVPLYTWIKCSIHGNDSLYNFKINGYSYSMPRSEWINGIKFLVTPRLHPNVGKATKDIKIKINRFK